MKRATSGPTRPIRHAMLALIAALGCAPASAATSVSKLPLDMNAGEGMIGSPTGGAFWSTYWVDAKWSLPADFAGPLTNGTSVQLGAIQTEDASREAACTVAPWIAGRRYCSRAGEPGPRFTALYAGLQSELVSRLRGGEAGDFRIYVGGGVAHLQGAILAASMQPYAAAETVYDSHSSWSARAAVYLCPSAPGGLGIAAPSVKIEYRF